MSELLRLFVSATRDLEPQRDVIGRMVAELPVQIGVEIRRTPLDGGKYDDIYEQIANVDRVYFLMGQDITAPAGAEWHLAWQLERRVYPLRTPGPVTPAAQSFLRSTIPLEWTTFRSSTALARLVALDLVNMLNHPTNRYGLTVNELELLQLHGRQIQHRAVDAPQEQTGAEGGGILLDDGRRDRMDAVLIGEDE